MYLGTPTFSLGDKVCYSDDSTGEVVAMVLSNPNYVIYIVEDPEPLEGIYALTTHREYELTLRKK